jgi:mitochondrial distribution and morphology protein 10
VISDRRASPVDGLPPRPDISNLMVNLQHDVGKWCTEYTWSAEDGMWGVRVLHNFGRLGTQPEEVGNATASTPRAAGVKRVDEEDAVEGGLKGRVSMGAELYFSAKEKSAGGILVSTFLIVHPDAKPSVSTGIRFTTLPDATPPSFRVPSSSSLLPPSIRNFQPPTTITALFNPMLGHMSGAYTAQVSRDLSLSSRFDFNMYSFASEWTMGAEYWLRRSATSEDPEVPHIPLPRATLETDRKTDDIIGVVKARASTRNVRNYILWMLQRSD